MTKRVPPSKHGHQPASVPGGPDVRAAQDGGGATQPPYSLVLVLPALASWATALVLLGCPAPVGATCAAVAAVGAVAVACRRTVPRAAVAALGAKTLACRRIVLRSAAAAHRNDTLTSRIPLHGWWHAPSSVPQLGPPADNGQRRSAVWLNVAVAVLACVAATSAGVAFRVHAVTTGPIAELAARNATVHGEIVLTGDPRVRRAKAAFHGESVVVEATLESLDTPDGRLAVHTPVVVFGSGGGWRSLLPSQRLRVTGRLGPAERGELVGAVLLVRGPPTVLSAPSGLQSAAGELRAGLRRAADVLPPDQRGLLPGLVVGDVSRMDPNVSADFRDAGLSHLTAVSGANLAIMSGAVVALSRLAGMPLAVRAVLAGIAMLGFAVVARPSPSVLRALLMGLVGAIALGTGRARDGVAALSATVLLLIMFDPGLAREYGFALSVSATGGILLLAPRWRDRLATRMPRWAAEAVAVPAAAQAAVTPVLVLMAGQLQLVAVPANLLAGPAVAPATVIGFAAALVAPVSADLARMLVVPAGYAVGWIITVAEHAARVPLADLPWPGGLPGLLLLAGAAAVAIPLLRRAGARTIVLIMGTAGMATLLIAGPVIAPWPPSRWLFVVCDVGQGDALAIAAGPGRAVVVDTGPDPTLVDRCLRDLDIREIPLVILTHPHRDHVGGLDGVFRSGRRVGAVVVSPGRAPAAESARISNDLTRRRIPEWVAIPGTRWRFGPSELNVLGPSPGSLPSGPGEGSVINNESVVLLVRWAAGSILLSGDVETEAQVELLRTGLPRADLLKVPHHGSVRQDPRFLAAIGARAALISVGSDNGYGHPAPRTVGLLHRLGMRVHRTDQSGALAVVDQSGRLVVVSRGRPDG
ncbi:ComEC/Rec2 family competence protein [Nonomuraea sp. NPDC059194]|uniref:ComEC/Rec2 family competence protein n=1 Tax=Nonomuraea sp. NPDC059194 TaxID=3346764 RepID=UPI00367FD19E